MPRPYSSALRLKDRSPEPGRIYLITTVTDHRRPIFSDFTLGRLVVNQLKHAHDEGIVQSIAWIVMPDHCQWLVELRHKTMGEVMCRVKSRSSRSINETTRSSERVWQKGYYVRALRKEDDLKATARYLIVNDEKKHAQLVRTHGRTLRPAAVIRLTGQAQRGARDRQLGDIVRNAALGAVDEVGQRILGRLLRVEACDDFLGDGHFRVARIGAGGNGIL